MIGIVGPNESVPHGPDPCVVRLERGQPRMDRDELTQADDSSAPTRLSCPKRRTTRWRNRGGFLDTAEFGSSSVSHCPTQKPRA